MRLELNTSSRFADLLNDENELVGRLAIHKGLSECESTEEWRRSLVSALEKAGYAAESLPDVQLPLSFETAIDRFAIRLVSL